MKRFGITGGHWLFYVSAAYFVIGMASIYNGATSVWLPPLYIFFLSMPFWIPPFGRAINLDVTWDIKMFDWIKGKKDAEDGASNVVKFPEPKSVPQMPEVKPPKEEPAKIYYRFGVTDNNRVSFQMGYSEITMSKEGVQNLIDQLEFFKTQLADDEDS